MPGARSEPKASPRQPRSQLELRAVDLMTGRFDDQPAIGLVDARAVVDHRVDFAGDRHAQAEFVGELHDDAGGLDTFGDLVHRRDDLVDRLAPAELFTALTGSPGLTGARDHPAAPAAPSRQA